ncbi:hypothetical protein HY494_00065 [Candidatus Woesearchaeota archaeon]|nr:hypothetical protein [Candidatus Woesearchaeota archaeon]
MVTVDASWKEIEHYISELQKKTSPAAWRVVNEIPISAYFIDRLIQKKWTVLCDYDKFSSICGSIDKNLPIIHLANHLAPHQRDITLFHELAHLRHPVLLSSCTDARMTPFAKNEREIIVEYLGRKARTDPELLRHAVVSFGLEPKIYDRASYVAFTGIKGQQCLPFMSEEYATTPLDYL